MKNEEMNKLEITIYRQIVKNTNEIIQQLLEDLKRKDKEIEILKGERKK